MSNKLKMEPLEKDNDNKKDFINKFNNKLKVTGIVGMDGKSYEYCPYSEISKNYDNTRTPVGINIVLDSFGMSKIPLNNQKLLDIGCGTGTFLEKVIDKFKTVTGLEYNNGMIVCAQERIKGYQDKVNLVQGSADNIPFPEKTFDAITINQVIHHFPSEDNYDFFGKVLKECYRILKPGGRIVLNTSTPLQQRDGFWWVSLFGNAKNAICNRFPPLNIIKEKIKESGLDYNEDSIIVPLELTLMDREKYLKKGILSAFDKIYQDGDSSWAMAENMGELKDILNCITDMICKGLDKKFIESREHLRLKTGQCTFITINKK